MLQLIASNLILTTIVLAWAICSLFSLFCIMSCKYGNRYERQAYAKASIWEILWNVLFAPIIWLGEFIKVLANNWHTTSAAVLVVVFTVALTGCQTNVVTAPHATFMVDSVTCPVASEAPSDKQ